MKNSNKQKKFLENLKNKWEQVKKDGIFNEKIVARESAGKGLGVFALSEIKNGETIELCHMILMNWKKKYVYDTSLMQYCYWDGCKCNDCKVHGNLGMILLGNGSIYNSADSDESRNANFYLYPSLKVAAFVAKRDITKGEEILTWWGEAYYNSWCKPKNENIK